MASFLYVPEKMLFEHIDDCFATDLGAAVPVYMLHEYALLMEQANKLAEKAQDVVGAEIRVYGEVGIGQSLHSVAIRLLSKQLADFEKWKAGE